jgi:hypothetical protein
MGCKYFLELDPSDEIKLRGVWRVEPKVKLDLASMFLRCCVMPCNEHSFTSHEGARFAMRNTRMLHHQP